MNLATILELAKNIKAGKVTSAIAAAVGAAVLAIRWSCGHHLFADPTCVDLLTVAAGLSAGVNLLSPKMTSPRS